MALFGNGKMGEFLLFVCNFQMTLGASGMIATGEKIQYLRTLLCGEVLRKLDTLSVEVGGTAISHLNRIILGLGKYFFPVHAFPKQKCAMSRIMRNPRKLKVRCYAARMIYLEEYLAVLPGAKSSENIGEELFQPKMSPLLSLSGM